MEWEPAILDLLLHEWTPRFGARCVFTILRNRIGEQLNLAEAQGEPGAKDRLEKVTRIRLVRRPEGDLPEGDEKIAGLAARRRDPDGVT